MPLHAPEDLARFQSGERRLIWARDTETNSLVELPDGEAASWRERARRSLVCPMPVCSDRSLHTVSRHPQRRDGFAHKAGSGGHSPESLFHLQGKAAIAAWLQKRHPGATVEFERESNAERERIADVMMTSANGAWRLAVEIQYAALTPEAWRARHASYARQGIVDTWLFGHHGLQAPKVRTSEHAFGTMKLSPLHQEVVAAGAPVLWFNPFDLTIAFSTAMVVEGGRTYEVLPESDVAQLDIAPLDDFSVGLEDGLGSVRTRNMVAATKWVAEHRAEVEAQQRAHAWAVAQRELRARAEEEAEEARRQKAREYFAVLRASQKAAEERQAREERERQRADALRQHEEGIARWASSEERTRVRILLGEEFPGWLGIGSELLLPVADEEWQAHLYEEFIHGRAGRERLDHRGMARYAINHYSLAVNWQDMVRTVSAWLDHIVEAGLIDCRKHAQHAFYYLLDERGQIARNRYRRGASQGLTAEGVPPPRAPESIPVAEIPSAASPKRYTHCRACGIHLDPWLAERGYHLFCGKPGWGSTPGVQEARKKHQDALVESSDLRLWDNETD